MRGLQNSLLGGYPSLILLVELLVLGDLFFELAEGGLKGRLLQSLGFLVVVDLASRYQLVERLVRILGNDGVDLLSSVLQNNHSVFSRS